MEPLPNTLSATALTCVRSERTLFKSLDLSCTEGQCLHVIGANGSGKSSLLRILCGLLSADEGEISWNDNKILQNAKFQQNLAYIGHKDGLKNELTTAENLGFYQALVAPRNDDLIDDYLARMKILSCADQSVQALSFGQRRRLAFSRLLVKPFSLWVLDEPFTGIDQEGRDLIEQLCQQHLQDGGMIVLTNHQSLKNSALAPSLKELNL
ncbi:UNVERIFIED_CONTAM: hypothetical protein GTU68_005914 [Idotea baltica]|nr:hypothetical protein [Idotea baltica]